MVIVTFKTKTEVFKFVQMCNDYGLPCALKPMPKQLKLGCGYAVEIFSGQASKAYLLVKSEYFPTFNGIYSFKNLNGRAQLSRIY